MAKTATCCICLDDVTLDPDDDEGPSGDNEAVCTDCVMRAIAIEKTRAENARMKERKKIKKSELN
jgi:hypothetical protein